MEQLLPNLDAGWNGAHTLWALFGAIFVWTIARWKSVIELRVLHSELAARNVGLFEKMIAVDERQRQISRELGALLQQMLAATSNGQTDPALQFREKAISVFLSDYIGSYYQYAGLGKWVYNDNKAELIEDELIPFLQTSYEVISHINNNALLTLTGCSPLLLRNFDFGFAVRYIRRNTPFWKRRRLMELNRIEKKLAG